ncbi:uncharacterized protein LOC123543034 [Mercenaria mercenaria]|uniref:uncharacterized protein LOC123543034 n=1 Tax=Mercenaria mercenaria TaxID=6596 RepID=UPI00234E4BB5|nr:uncharacterized protein LOC123543034 [Mercenaria mercenaria]
MLKSFRRVIILGTAVLVFSVFQVYKMQDSGIYRTNINDNAKNDAENVHVLINKLQHVAYKKISQNFSLGDSENKLDHEGSSHDMFCVEKSKWGNISGLPAVKSNMSVWEYKRNITCPDVQFGETAPRPLRSKLVLNCDNVTDSVLKVEMVNNSNDIHVTKFGNACLNKFIDSCCKGPERVPNIVHYVWFMRNSLDFISFISILSVVRFVNPCVIVFHGDRLPTGKYWDFLMRLSPNIIHIKRQKVNTVFGQRVKFKQHSSDVMRIEALLMYGGIYMDTDTVLVKSIDSLRQYPCVMSTQSGSLGSAFIMAEKNATFLNMWLEGYKTNYRSSHYYYNAMIYPRQLAYNHTDIIHVEDGTVSRPKDLYVNKPHSKRFESYNWSNIFGMHLFTRNTRTTFNEDTIKDMRSVTGAILRHILFGNKELCHLLKTP